MSTPTIVASSFGQTFNNSASGISIAKPAISYVVGDWILFAYASQSTSETGDLTLDSGVSRIGLPYAAPDSLKRMSGWYCYPVTSGNIGSIPATFNFGRTGGGTRQNLIVFVLRANTGVLTLQGYSTSQQTGVSPPVIQGMSVAANNSIALALLYGTVGAGPLTTNPVATGMTLQQDVQNPSNSTGVSRTCSEIFTANASAGTFASVNAGWDGTMAQASGHMLAVNDGTAPAASNTITSWRNTGTFPAVAHRGAPNGTTRGEFSRESYDLAVGTYGFTALEVSLHQTSDGFWVLNHDATTGAQYTTDLTIASSTLAALQALTRKFGTNEPMMTYQQFTARYPQYVWFVENKTYANFTAFFNMLQTEDPSKVRTVFKASGDTGSAFTLAKSYGFKTWGYWFGTAGASNLPTELISAIDWAGLSGGLSPNNPTAQTWWDYCNNRSVDILSHIVYQQADWDSMRLQGASMGMVNNPTVMPLNGQSVVSRGDGVEDLMYYYYS